MAIHAINISGSATSTGSFGTIQVGGKHIYGDTDGIGIGTANPDSVLHVVGTAKFDSAIIQKVSDNSYDIIRRLEQPEGYKVYEGWKDSITAYGISVSNPGTTYDLVVKNDGNVGIGTTNAVERLTVGVAAVNNTISDVLRITTTGTYDSGGSGGNGGALSFGQFHNTYPDWQVAQIAGTRNGVSWDGALHFFTNDGSGQTTITEKIRIESDGDLLLISGSVSGSSTSTGSFGSAHIAGNVGIGTTSPEQTLHIKSTTADVNLKLQTTSGTHNASIIIDSPADRDAILEFQEAGSYKWLIYSRGGHSDKLYFTSPSAANAIVIQQDGKVGIGTTSPAFP